MDLEERPPAAHSVQPCRLRVHYEPSGDFGLRRVSCFCGTEAVLFSQKRLVTNFRVSNDHVAGIDMKIRQLATRVQCVRKRKEARDD